MAVLSGNDRCLVATAVSTRRLTVRDVASGGPATPRSGTPPIYTRVLNRGLAAARSAADRMFHP